MSKLSSLGHAMHLRNQVHTIEPFFCMYLIFVNGQICEIKFLDIKSCLILVHQKFVSEKFCACDTVEV